MMVLDLNQSSIWPRSSTTSRQPSVIAISRKPIQSTFSPPASRSRRSRSSTSGSSTSQCTSASEAMPIGTLMKKIQCQEKLSVIQPPTVGPTVGRDDHGDAVEREGLAAPLRRKRVGEDGLLAGRHAAAAEPLQDAEEDQRAQARRQSAQQRAHREQRHADHVEALAADDVRQPAAHRQHHGVGDQIGRDHPGALVDARRHGAGDVAQRDIGDRGVEHDHEGRDRDHDGDQPGIAVAGGRAAVVPDRRLSRLPGRADRSSHFHRRHDRHARARAKRRAARRTRS